MTEGGQIVGLVLACPRCRNTELAHAGIAYKAPEDPACTKCGWTGTRDQLERSVVIRKPRAFGKTTDQLRQDLAALRAAAT